MMVGPDNQLGIFLWTIFVFFVHEIVLTVFLRVFHVGLKMSVSFYRFVIVRFTFKMPSKTSPWVVLGSLLWSEMLLHLKKAGSYGWEQFKLDVAHSCWVGDGICSAHCVCVKCIALMVGIAPFLILFVLQTKAIAAVMRRKQWLCVCVCVWKNEGTWIRVYWMYGKDCWIKGSAVAAA